MICPKCKSKSKVYDSRPTKDGTIRRNRECLKCRHRYATVEVLAEIKKETAKPVQKKKLSKKAQSARSMARRLASRMSDDELFEALEKGFISADDLD